MTTDQLTRFCKNIKQRHLKLRDLEIISFVMTHPGASMMDIARAFPGYDRAAIYKQTKRIMDLGYLTGQIEISSRGKIFAASPTEKGVQFVARL